MAALNVIGLVSGGKDSFFSLLHCLAHGHRIVALANLLPADGSGNGNGDGDGEQVLDSFMYQTVGHSVIPLYAAATGLPLYREPIVGGAVQTARDYEADGDEDETESMTVLLRRVMADHPAADAVCAGALLSTYQRTRVESVATRLGLVSLAYLWKYPVLPSLPDPSPPHGIPPYLADLATAGFDARIVMVASGGLDADLLWTNVASAAGAARLHRALARLGLAGGADGQASMLGEGGEYETLVVAGPRALFRDGAIAVAAEDRHVVPESGGTARLQIRHAEVVPRGQGGADDDDGLSRVRQPPLLDPRFADVLSLLKAAVVAGQEAEVLREIEVDTQRQTGPQQPPRLTTWRFVSSPPVPSQPYSIADATQDVVRQVRERLRAAEMSATSVMRSLVVLRRMADFPTFNAIYGTLFRGSPNPPARVTIACGAQLPDGVDVAVYLGVVLGRKGGDGSNDRQGLHVQSRSYWAPANIGPYSQAVSVPAASLFSDHIDARSTPRIVSVAGQIPLVPATMELPDQAVEARATESGSDSGSPASAPASFAFQATLALQHLWRIGLDVGVQWWSSAVAYVPAETADGPSSGAVSLAEKAVLVARAWRAAHAWQPSTEEDGDEEDEDGPDLWDRRFDARYVLFNDDAGDDDAPRLPDWRVVAAASDSSGLPQLPPVFLAEVHGLPRAAPVEWHAHAGFSQVGCGCIEGGTVANGGVCQTLLRIKQGDGSDADGEDDEDEEVEDRQRQPRTTRVIAQTVETWDYSAAADAAARLQSRSDVGAADIVYIDRQVCGLPEGGGPLVPCASLWNAHGGRLSAVVVRTTIYEEG